MADDILCPTCQHSLAFHKFDYGSCDAPLGGLTSKNVCGCPFTVHMYIQNMQPKDSTTKQLEELEKSHQTCMDELAYSLGILKLVQKKIIFLESKLKTIRELVEKLKPVEKTNPLSGWFDIGYRNKAIVEIVNEIILELEKDMENG